MNLEKNLWIEDPAKAWMKEHQCPLIRSYLKEKGFPALEKNRILVSSLFLSSLSKRMLMLTNGRIPSSLPMDYLTDESVFSGWGFSFSVLCDSKFIMPRHLVKSTPTVNVFDVEMELLGEGDVFFSVQMLDEESGRLCLLYFTPTHIEEACCIMRGREMKTEPVSRSVVMNRKGWDRLGMQNPFRLISV